MRLMRKALLSIPLLGLLVSGCAGGNVASGYDHFNKDGIDTEPGNFDFDGNFVKPEITIDGDDSDEAWKGSNVSETLSFMNETNSVSVKLLRGEHSLFFYFRVTDKYICAKGNDNGEDVAHSDSVELYIDSLNDGGTAPRTDDYQINLGVHDKTRILVGSGTSWSTWNGLCQYEVKIDGTLNNNSDVDSGYSVEGMIPWNQIGCTKDSSFGVAFGNVDKKTDDAQEETTWNGLTFEGMLIEPQTPNNYITYAGNSFASRGIVVNNIIVKGTVFDENDQPIAGATVQEGENQYLTDANGNYTIPNYNPLEPLALTVSYAGYITHKYTVHSADLVLANGIFRYDVKLQPGTGDDEVEPNYVYIGETTRKLIHSLQLHVSRHDKMGLNLRVSIVNETKFDKYQQYEFYIDTGSNTRTLTDDNSWCFAIVEDRITFITNDPKMTAKKHATSLIELVNKGNVYEIYVPYALLGVDENAVIGYSFGIWDTLIKDWDPMNRDGVFALVEDPSLYIRQQPDGTIVEDTTGWAGEYDFANDNAPYVSLGRFSGKSVSYVTFSTITAKINHTDSQYLYVQFTTNQAEWRREEIIELFIDSGSPSRTIRDGESYILSISTAHGKIQQFHSYSSPEKELNKNEVTILMDAKHMLVRIPYTTLSSTLVQSTILGFTFGVFNNYAGDWDGYAYNDKYVDPEKPNQYVRVDMTNEIQ